MKDQSHKDEMSAALRRDFERLRERGVSTTLTPPAGSEPQPTPDASVHADSEPERERGELEQPDEPLSDPDEPASADTDPVPRGRFARLFGRQ